MTDIQQSDLFYVFSFYVKKPPLRAEVEIGLKQTALKLSLTSFHFGIFLINNVDTAFATDNLAVLITNLFAF